MRRFKNHRSIPRRRAAGRRLRDQLRTGSASSSSSAPRACLPSATKAAASGPATSTRTTALTSYSLGPVYEPLVFVNPLQNAKTTSDASDRLDVGERQQAAHLHHPQRREVDRREADDRRRRRVTFNLLKQNKALDLHAIWSVLSSVKQTGQPGGDDLQGTRGDLLLLHRRSDRDRARSHLVEDRRPGEVPDTHPVGTGAYVVNPCTRQNITYKANPHYWQPGLPKHRHRQLPGVHQSNDTANTTWRTGRRSGAASSSRASRTSTLDKSPNNHYWFPPVANVSLLHQPDQPDPEERGRPAGHGLRDRPAAKVIHHRRVRLRAALEPKRASSRRRSPAGSTLHRRRRSATTTPTTRPRPPRS